MKNIFVNPNKRTNSADGVFCTIAEAAAFAEENTNIILSDNIHQIEKTVDFKNKKHICLTGDTASVVSSNIVLDNKRFTKTEGKPYYTYQLEKTNGEYPLFRDFYVNGKHAKMAESDFDIMPETIPDEKNRANAENFKTGLYVNASLLSDADYSDIYPCELFLHLQWESELLHVRRIDKNDTIEREEKQYCRIYFADGEFEGLLGKYHVILSLKDRPYCFRNHYSLVKKPGDFAYDFTRGIIYYYPNFENEIESGIFEYPALSTLFNISDTDDIRFEKIIFTGTTNTYGLKEEYCSYQANTLADNTVSHQMVRQRVLCGAIVGKNVKNLTVHNCDFTDIGTNGILTYDRGENISVTDCSFSDIAMSAIVLGNATVSWNDTNSLKNIRIENNIISHIAYRYPTSPALTILQVDGLTITHNTIFDTAYSAISVGWGWEQVDYAYGEKVNIKNAVISYNKIEKFMQVLKDGGAIYVVGANCINTYKPHFNSIHDNYMIRSKTDTQNAERGIYLDGSSSNWHVYNNVGSGSAFPIFVQFHVPSQFTYNNLAEHNYWTEKIPAENNVYVRNTILKECYDDASSLSDMFEKYPESKIIAEFSGIYR